MLRIRNSAITRLFALGTGGADLPRMTLARNLAPWILGLAASTLLQAGTGCLRIDNQSDSAWLLRAHEGKIQVGSWRVESEAAGSERTPGTTIAAQSSVSVRVEVPAGTQAPSLYLCQAGARSTGPGGFPVEGCRRSGQPALTGKKRH